MKLMSRDFTTKEKILLILLTVILLGAVYYLAVDQPVRNALAEAADAQENLTTELMVLQQKTAVLSKMQKELNTIQNHEGYGEMGSYNHSKAELDELNQLLQDADSYDISFSNVTRNGDLIRRNFSLTFSTSDYEKAEELIQRLCKGSWRCLISGINIVSQEDSLEQGGVNVGLSATFYETMTGGTPDSGLPADTSAVQGAQ